MATVRRQPSRHPSRHYRACNAEREGRAGKHMFSWDGDADDDAMFDGMHGDEMEDEDEGVASV